MSTQLGKYRLVAEVARGGMGIVYLAVASGPARFNKLLVIKELKPELGRGVHQHAPVADLDQHAGARALVARVVRLADVAVAPHDRDAVRRPGAENREPQPNEP